MNEELIVHVLFFAGAGIVVGYASGLFGIGGGVILVPTFLTIFPRLGVDHDVLMHCAVGTCLALVVPGAIASTLKHFKLGNLDLAFVWSWLPWIAAGTVAGVFTVELLKTHDLKVIFTVYLFLTAVYVAARKASDDGESDGPPFVAKAIGGAAIGNFSVWLGLGGGTFSVPFLRAFHYPIKRSIAVSAATGLVIGTGGALGAIAHGWGAAGRGSFSLGYVNGLAFLVIAPVLTLFAPLGAKAATKASDAALKWIYVALLFGIATYMSIITF